MGIIQRGVLQALNPLSNRVTFTAIVPGPLRTGALNARGLEKVAISDQYLAIARKRLKIGVYMLRCVWQALNSLSIHVTFTAIVPWGVPRGKQNVVKNAHSFTVYCWKPLTRYISEMVEDRWVHACEAFDKHWILFRSMLTFTAMVPWRRLPSWRTCSWR